jgi:hypothetical protein
MWIRIVVLSLALAWAGTLTGCSESKTGRAPEAPIDATGPDVVTNDVAEGDTVPDTAPEPDTTPEPDAPPQHDVVEPPVDAAAVTCELQGAAGDLVDCPVHIARAAEAFAPSTEVTVGVSYASEAASLEKIVELTCAGGNCLETLVSGGSGATGAIASGHEVSLSPGELTDWLGAGSFHLKHPAGTVAISQAYIDTTGAVVGDSLVVMLRFLLTETLDTPRLVTLTLEEALSGTGDTLPVASQQPVLITADSGGGCGDTVCFDGNPCTDDTCEDGACVFSPREGSCDDGNACTSSDTCSDGVCVGDAAAASGATCTGANLCTEVGTCDGAGECAFDEALSVDCSDVAGSCAEATCNPTTGTCLLTAKTGESCDDADMCTSGDTCDDSGNCTGQVVVCDDSVACTTNGCDPATGCVYTPQDSECNDANPCTSNTCGDQGCAVADLDGGCDDGDSCTLDDACMAGACSGTPDIATCGCAVDEDCGPLSAADLCQGEFQCLDGVCTKVPGSAVVCPTNGYQCMDSWTCGADTGECSAQADTNCDDAMSCTVDSCSASKGCQYEFVDLCPLGPLCEISGSAGDTVECVLRVARGSGEHLPATGANTRFGWDGSKLALEQLVDSYCFGGGCWPFDALTCAADGSGCSSQPLQSGHSMLVVPNDLTDWTDWISITFIHQSSVDTPLTQALLNADGEVGEKANVITLRFKLQEDIPPDDPETIEYTEASFDRVDMPLKASIEDTLDGSAVITGGAE